MPANLEVGDLHLFEGEHELMDRILGKANCVLEFGPGNCALRSLALGAKKAVVVDPDITWLTKFQAHADVRDWIAHGALRIVYADIGPIDEWGNPTDPSTRETWPNYVASGWSSIRAADMQPDLVLMDGRSRVAVGLSALHTLQGKQFKLALHDAGPKRPYYRTLLEFYDVQQARNTLITLVPRSNYSVERLLNALISCQYDVR